MFSYGRCAFPWRNNATWLRLSYLLLEFSDYIFGSCIFLAFQRAKVWPAVLPRLWERCLQISVWLFSQSSPATADISVLWIVCQCSGYVWNLLENFWSNSQSYIQLFFLYCPKSRLQYYSLVNRIGCNVGFYWKWFC